jgi:glutamine---fructose-6-phosphate transaminase (isomerizing)
MCGIFGYAGDRNMESVLLVGLERLSYRGYDSSGIAIISDKELSVWRKSGKLHELEGMLKNLSITGTVGIGHTRWATHGRPNEVNAHPHMSGDSRVAIIHNGIIENFIELKNKLMKKGYIFRSETDSEVVAHLIEDYYQDSLAEAIEKAVVELRGTYAIAAIAERDPEKMVVCRKGSPLIIGIGKDEHFISSDINALITHTKDIMFLDDDEIGIITKKSCVIKKVGGAQITKDIQHISWDPKASDKKGYDHYMLKEIYEQPAVVRRIITKMLSEDNSVKIKHLRSLTKEELSNVGRFIIQACGTSWHAGIYAKYMIEKYARVLTEVDISSEFRYRQMIGAGNEVVIALSQSGETADTLACLREAKSKFFKALSFVNSKNSTMDRESDGVIYTHAGQEVGVASTKNFVAQLVTIYLFTIHIALEKQSLSQSQADTMIEDLKKIPEYIDSILNKADKIKKIADKYYLSGQFLFIGRSLNYPSALEGALKLKEISYIHATGYPAGELKHGPIALIDSKLPVVCIATQSETYEKMLTNIQEVKARKGKVIMVATEGDEVAASYADDTIFIPKVSEELSPILVAIPLQLLAYYIAIKLDCDVDQPRNLAKSVTVE